MTASDDHAWEAIVTRFRELEFEVKTVEPGEVEALRSSLAPLLGADHAYFDFLGTVGFLATKGPYGMLHPSQVLHECHRQQTFFRASSFGDRPEDAQALEREQAFRSTLVPFQFAHTRGDFYCFVSGNRKQGIGDPLILDVYHDDFELTVPGSEPPLEDPNAATPYTRSLAEHLGWVADVLVSDRDYPPLR